MLWDALSGNVRGVLSSGSASMAAVAFNSDGKTLASIGKDGQITLWDITTGHQSFSIPGPAPVLHSAAANGAERAVAGGRARSALLGMPPGTASRPSGATAASTPASMAPQAQLVQMAKVTAPGGRGGEQGQFNKVLKQKRKGVIALALSPDGTLLGSASGDNRIRLWDATTGRERFALTGIAGIPVTGVAFTGNGKRLASVARDSVVRLWDVTTGASGQVLRGHEQPIRAIASSTDGKYLASAGEETRMMLWDAATGKLNKILYGHADFVNGVAFSADSKLLASAGADSRVLVWDVTTGKLLRTLRGHSGDVNAVAFSPDGRLLASAGDDSLVIVWDMATGQQWPSLQGHQQPVRAVAFSWDGQSLASAGEDTRIILWDIASRKARKVLSGTPNFINALIFGKDGTSLIAGSEDSQIRIWDPPRSAIRKAIQVPELPSQPTASSAVSLTAGASGSAPLHSADWRMHRTAEVERRADSRVAYDPLSGRPASSNPHYPPFVKGGNEGTSRHSAPVLSNGEWRNPEHMDVTRSAVPGAWIPAIRAGMTVTRGLTGNGVGREGGFSRTHVSIRTTSFEPPTKHLPQLAFPERSACKGDACGLNHARLPEPGIVDRLWNWLLPAAAAATLPDPNQGPGGPILVITSASSTYGKYYAEILRTEGLNEFAVADIGSVTEATLSAYDVVILAPTTLTAGQVSMFSTWVTAGGNLIAMRPDSQLAGLLGLSSTGSTLSNAYLRVDTSTSPGNGIVGQPMQFHGTADRYTLNGASSVATLYTDATTATSNPAVTLRSVGVSGGHAAAFAYDLATSIVYTRQGNPAWAAQERDGLSPIRSDDKFYGAATGDPQPDWVDLTNEVAIPQADEQQRLLANLILQMDLDKKPLPRFWYFPHGKKAVVIMTGDDHGNGGTAGRFDQYIAASPAGCNVANWECIRSTSYIYEELQNLTPAQAASYTAQGFEVGLHLNTNCADFTPASLDTFYSQQVSGFTSSYPSIPAPITQRHHCIAWSDWVTGAKTELKYGMRLDTSYYFWPPGWVNNRPGHFTGSAMPMRFADLDGTLIDVYNAPTQMTDESGQAYPFTSDALLSAAVGPQGYYGAYTVNAHTDTVSNPVSDGVVASALARGVPIVSSVQMLNWLDARNSSSFGELTWSGNALSFTVTPGSGANGLQAMVPTHSSAGVLTGITRVRAALCRSRPIPSRASSMPFSRRLRGLIPPPMRRTLRSQR